MKDVTLILLAAGSSSRMGRDKLTLSLGGRTPLEYSLLAFLTGGAEELLEVILAVSPATRPLAQELASRYEGPELPIRLVPGGDSRGESVYNALLAAKGPLVAIHDAARCLVSRDIIAASIAMAREKGSGVAALPCRDTLWRHTGQGTVSREGLLAAQTPQTFSREKITAAYAAAREAGISATDDAALYQRHWGEICFSPGSLRNQKLTCPEDIPFFSAQLSQGGRRTGYGEDTHRLTPERPLVLGGVNIPFRLGLLGHSDADVLTHGVMDALLGAAALRDIGVHFPDTDPQYKGICSLLLLQQVQQMLAKKGFLLGNLDATILAQAPRLSPYIPQMIQNLASALCCDPGRINIKATTPEGCGPEGALQCITVRCVCSLEEFSR